VVEARRAAADTSSMDKPDLSSLSDDALAQLAVTLAEEERHSSKRRTVLQARIDFVRAGGATSEADADEQLRELTAQEQDVSRARHLLHARISEVEVERARRAVARADADPRPAA
jgi:RsiG-like